MNRRLEKSLRSAPVTASDLAIPDHVVIQCPACGASESAEPYVLAGASDDRLPRMWRDVAIGRPGPRSAEASIWSARPRRASRTTSWRRNGGRSSPIPTARRAPGRRRWRAMYWPEPPRPRRFPMIAGAVAALLFLAAFFGGREAGGARRSRPRRPLCGDRPAGQPGGHARSRRVAANRTPTAAGDRVVVSGTIRNVSGAGDELSRSLPRSSTTAPVCRRAPRASIPPFGRSARARRCRSA